MPPWGGRSRTVPIDSDSPAVPQRPAGTLGTLSRLLASAVLPPRVAKIRAVAWHDQPLERRARALAEKAGDGDLQGTSGRITQATSVGGPVRTFCRPRRARLPAIIRHAAPPLPGPAAYRMREGTSFTIHLRSL